MAQVSILFKGNIERGRLDAEFYQKIYVQTVRTLRSIPHCKLGDVCFVTSGSTPPDRDESLTDGIILLKTQNIREGYIDLSNDVYYIDEVLDQRLKSTRLKPHDVLINIVGATLEVIGRVAIIPNDFPRANITQAMALIRTTGSEFLPEYVFGFLYSKYGRLQVCRLARPTEQFNINHQELREIVLPKMPAAFQHSLVDLVNRSGQLLRQSKTKRVQAETALLENLDFTKMPHKYALTYITTLSQCVKNSRIDSEFFRPEYDIIDEKMREVSKRNNWEIRTIDEISEPLKYGTSEKLTYLNDGLPFLRITDIQDMDFNPDSLCHISDEDAEKVKYARVSAGDLVVSRSGTLGLTVPIRKELENGIFGSYFIRVRPKVAINQDYLALYLNSFFGRFQVNQICTGALQTNLTIPAIEKIRVVVPSPEFQSEIGKMLTEARKLRNRARKTLEEIRLRVEKEIGRKSN